MTDKSISDEGQDPRPRDRSMGSVTANPEAEAQPVAGWAGEEPLASPTEPGESDSPLPADPEAPRAKVREPEEREGPAARIEEEDLGGKPEHTAHPEEAEPGPPIGREAD